MAWPGSALDAAPMDGRRRDLRGGRRPLRMTQGDPSRRPSRVPRRQLAVLVLALAATWVVLVFGRALDEADAVEERAAAARAENAALRARLEAGREEVAAIQADEFVRLQARAYGLGERGERVFALRPGAPDPEPIVPLGAAASPAAPPTPLEDWLDLLFGSGQRGGAGPPGADGAPSDD